MIFYWINININPVKVSEFKDRCGSTRMGIHQDRTGRFKLVRLEPY